MRFAVLGTTVAEQDRHVDIAALAGQAALAGHQAHVQVRMGLVEARKARHQPVGSEGVVGGHLEHLVALARAQRGDAGIDRLEAGGHVAEQELAGVGEHDASMDALEQRGRQLLLQAFDLLADRRLGGPQPRRQR